MIRNHTAQLLLAQILLASSGLAVGQNRLLQGLSPDGINFVASQCKNEKLVSMHLANYRRWQHIDKEILKQIKAGEIDGRLYGKAIREMINLDLDELHQSRKSRNPPINEDESMKLRISEITFDLMHLSAMKVFISDRYEIEDARIRRLLEENCLSLLFSKE